MNGTNILIDTNVALYLLSGDVVIASLLNGQNLYISEITEMELLGFPSLKKADIPVIEEFVSDCRIVELNSTIKNQTIGIRRKHKVKLPDAIIAATSKYLKMPLLTADKDFSKIEGLQVILYEKNK